MSGKRAIVGARIFDGDAWHDGAALVLDGGKVGGLTRPDALEPAVERIEAAGSLIAPGFVDIQVNGGGGVLFNNTPTVEGIGTICAAHAAFGTTALLVTLITDTPDNTATAIDAGIAAREAGTTGFLGLHLEGPHISLARKGTHDPALIRPMQADDLDAIVSASRALDVLLTTVAPESVSPKQIEALAKAGVRVSLGHSNASYAAARSAAEAGAALVTHLFNAMSPLAHREPGLVGATLDLGGLSSSLIADGIHVDPAAIAIALRAKRGPGRIFLTTDAMATVGSGLAGFRLNGRDVFRRDGRLTLADGTLAGADIDMLSSVRLLSDRIGLPLEEALRMASTYAAEAIGIADRKGRIAPGMDADFVVLTPQIEIVSTWIAGEPVFKAAQIQPGSNTGGDIGDRQAHSKTQRGK